MTLPRVQIDTADAVVAEIDQRSDQYDPDWVAKICDLIDERNPVVARYIMAAGTVCGIDTAKIGLIIYRLLDMQEELDNEST